MGDTVCCPALASFDLIYVFIGVLNLRPYKSLICRLMFAFMFGVYISAYVAQCLVCFGGHILNMVMSRPRYFACSTASQTWPCRTY